MHLQSVVKISRACIALKHKLLACNSETPCNSLTGPLSIKLKDFVSFILPMESSKRIE